MRKAAAILKLAFAGRERSAPPVIVPPVADPIPLPPRDGVTAELVALTVAAVNQLAPATLRSATFGTARKVVVRDPKLGAVFRAALQEMGERRSTDRLIEIVVESDAPQR